MEFECVHFIQSLNHIDDQKSEAKKGERSETMHSGESECANSIWPSVTQYLQSDKK